MTVYVGIVKICKVLCVLFSKRWFLRVRGRIFKSYDLSFLKVDTQSCYHPQCCRHPDICSDFTTFFSWGLFFVMLKQLRYLFHLTTRLMPFLFLLLKCQILQFPKYSSKRKFLKSELVVF